MMRPRFALFFFLILVTASFAQQVGRLPRIPLPDASPVVDTVEGIADQQRRRLRRHALQLAPNHMRLRDVPLAVGTDGVHRPFGKAAVDEQ